MKKHRSPHGKENAIQKPGHPATNTARDDPVFFDGWRGIWGKLPPKSFVKLETADAAEIVRASGNVTYSRNRPWWGMEPYMFPASAPTDRRQIGESHVEAVPVPPASADSYHYIYTICHRNLSPRKPTKDLQSPPPIQEQTPMGNPPDLHKRNPISPI